MPGTSFKRRSSTGVGCEHWMLYWLLRWVWPDMCKDTGAMNVMPANMSRDRCRDWIGRHDPEAKSDQSLAKQFRRAIKVGDKQAMAEGWPTVRRHFRDLCRRCGYSRKHIPDNDRRDRNALIGELRSAPVVTCIQALELDLIIPDEFQHFKYLLQPDDLAGSLARHLFIWGDTRVLLLSAPYTVYILSH